MSALEVAGPGTVKKVRKGDTIAKRLLAEWNKEDIVQATATAFKLGLLVSASLYPARQAEQDILNKSNDFPALSYSAIYWAFQNGSSSVTTAVHELERFSPYLPANDNEPIKSRFNLTWFDDIKSSMPKETIIKGVLGVSEFSLISGLPASGKSVIATDAGCHVSAGMEWFGRKVRQGLVVYIAAERKALTERRMLAFRKTHGVSDVPLLVLGGRIDLTSSESDARAIAATVKAAEAECGYPCVWIIVDTLTRTFGPGDQNASKDMSKFIRACDVLMGMTGAHVTVIHHTAWSGERGKGAIDLDGAVDVSFLVTKKRTSHELRCDGANDGDEGEICRFSMRGVEVGIDEDGAPTTAPIVIPSDDSEASERLLGAAKGNNLKALESLNSAIVSKGELPPDGSPGFPEGVPVVTRDTWRARYYEDNPGVKSEAVRKRFNRAVEALLAEKYINQVGEWFWPS